MCIYVCMYKQTYIYIYIYIYLTRRSCNFRCHVPPWLYPSLRGAARRSVDAVKPSDVVADSAGVKRLGRRNRQPECPAKRGDLVAVDTSVWHTSSPTVATFDVLSRQVSRARP